MNTFDILEQNLILTAATAEEVAAECTPQEDFPPFTGHFPDFKLLPGVAQISLVTTAMRKIFGEQTVLCEITRIKLTNPALPGAKIEITGKITRFEDDKYTVQARLSSQDKQISTLKLLYKCNMVNNEKAS